MKLMIFLIPVAFFSLKSFGQKVVYDTVSNERNGRVSVYKTENGVRAYFSELAHYHTRSVTREDKKKPKYGYSNIITGKMEIPFTYDDAKYFDPYVGLAGVKLHGKWGFIDSSGKVVIPFQFDEVSHEFNGYRLCAVKKRNKWGFINSCGNVVIPIIFDKINDMDLCYNDFACVKGTSDVTLNGVLGWIDNYGNFTKYDNPKLKKRHYLDGKEVYQSN